MKAIKYTLLVGLAALMSASCGRKETYDFATFATFYNSSVMVDETVGTLEIPVILRNGSDACRFTVKLNDGSARVNENFTLAEPATGVLAFAAGESEKNIVLNIVNQNGIFTGNLDFSVEIQGVSEDATVGNLNKMNVKIIDTDHPLVIHKVAGSYTVSQTGMNSSYGHENYSFPMNLTTDAEDATKVWCDAIMMMAYTYNNADGQFSVYGYVSEDFNTITFPTPQPVAFSTGYGTLSLHGGAMGTNGAGTAGFYTQGEADLVFTRANEDAPTWECAIGMYMLDEYIWPSYGGWILGDPDGCKTVWTRK